MKRRVCSRSQRASADSMHKKKRSTVARSIPCAAKIGWFNRGSPLRNSIPTTPEMAANSTVNSKMIGMNIGQLLNGLPPTLKG